MPIPIIPEFPNGTRYFVWGSRYDPNYPQTQHVVAPPNSYIRAFSQQGEKTEGSPYVRVTNLNHHIRREDFREVTREAFLFVINGFARYVRRSTFIQRRTIRNPSPVYEKPAPVNHKIGVPKNRLP